MDESVECGKAFREIHSLRSQLARQHLAIIEEEKCDFIF